MVKIAKEHIENSTNDSSQFEHKMIEGMTELNKRVDMLDKKNTKLFDNLATVIENVQQISKNIDQVISCAKDEKTVSQGIKYLSIPSDIKKVTSQVKKEISALSQASLKQIDSYTEESRKRRDSYERFRKKEMYLMRINVGFLFLNTIVLIWISLN